jgi:addiction module RelE/StbE family toxin
VRIDFTPEFKRNLRGLAKKYRQINLDIQPVIERLQNGEIIGDQITGLHLTLYKLRIQNRDIQRGKSSGYRLIYWLKAPDYIVLVTVYSKLDQGDITARMIKRILKEID